jgi:hypothetical protein
LKNAGSISTKIIFSVFLLSLGGLLNFIIPPLQNPDEPQHFGMILSLIKENADQLEIEHEIIRLMDENHWWQFLGMGRPGNLEQGFSKSDFFDFKDFKSVLGSRIVFHYGVAQITKILPTRSTLEIYYFCRGLSFALILFSLFFTYLTYLKIASINHSLYFLGFLFLLFLPQFMIISISVNSDAFLILLGALFFYASVILFIDGFSGISTLLIVFIPLIGLVSDKSSIIFSIMLCILLILIRYSKKLIYSLGLTLSAFFLIALWGVWYNPLIYYNLLLQIKKLLALSLAGSSILITGPAINLKFFLTIIDSILLKFGWMAFSTHKSVYIIWRMFFVTAGVGTLLFFINALLHKRKGQNQSEKDRLNLKLCVFFFLAVFIQFGSSWLIYGGNNIGAQGRHFFPLLIPISFLFIHGNFILWNKVGTMTGKAMIYAIIVLEFFLLGYVVWNHIAPLYHLSLISPHAGL